MVQWKRLRGRVLAILRLSWRTACIDSDTLKSQESETLRFVNTLNCLPAHKASGVDPQNGLDPFRPALCQLPAGSALRDTEEKLQDDEVPFQIWHLIPVCMYSTKPQWPTARGQVSWCTNSSWNVVFPDLVFEISWWWWWWWCLSVLHTDYRLAYFDFGVCMNLCSRFCVWVG